jgi:phosphatidate cytidylyltransferase
MALNLPTFYKRTASAVVFAAVMLTGLLWNDWAFLVLVCLIEVLCLREYFRLMQKIDTQTYWPRWLPVVMQIIALVLFFLFSANINSLLPGISKYLFLILPVLPASLLLCSVLFKKAAFHAFLQSVGGVLYITVPMLLLLGMHASGFVLPLAVILMIWCNDTMAYLVGSFIGKTKFSDISPNKTWEGVIGGILLTIIAAGVYAYFSGSYTIAGWLILALLVTVAGTLGDLLESKLKRMANVKDTGTLMPGHGGALDRFDSLLVAAPFAYVYVIYFMQ